jgi:multiple sugar transport system substrate-binding protein
MWRLACALALAVGLGTATAGCTGPAPAGGSDGDIVVATGQEITGQWQRIIDEGWNRSHHRKVRLVELSDNADAQRASMVKVLGAHSSAYDVLSMDVINTAEFAAKGWIVPLPAGEFDLADRLPATVASATWRGTLYGAPWVSDGGMLYYRTDLVSKPPATWNELVQDCQTIARPRGMGCYAGQYAPYEGLTVNVDEAIHDAGGQILSDDGGTVTVDSQAARHGLQFLVDGFRQGWIPHDALTYKEEESRVAFEQGQLLFLRNWPYIYGLAHQIGPDSKVAGRFDVAPLPAGPSGRSVSSLGGHNLAVSAYSTKRSDAIDFVRWMTSMPPEKLVAQRMAYAPTFASLYDDPELRRQLPYLGVLKQSVEGAAPRPRTPEYPAVTLIIQREATQALLGNKTVDRAIADMAAELSEKIRQ